MADESLIDSFKAVTGCNSEVASHFLDACSGDLQSAIDLFLQQESTASTGSPASSSTLTRNTSGGAPAASTKLDGPDNDESVRAPIPQRQGVLVQESYANTYAPRRRRLTNSVFDRNRDFRAEAEEQYNMLTGRKEQSEAQVKRRTLESLFQPPEDLIHNESWESARCAAEKRRHWLLVNVQSSQEFASQVLNRDVWSNQAVKELVRNNFVFWQVYRNDADGQRFQTYYKVTDYPFLGIMDPRTGELLLRMNKILDPMSFCEAVTNFLETHPSFESLDAKMTFSSTSTTSCSRVEENGFDYACTSGLKRKKGEDEGTSSIWNGKDDQTEFGIPHKASRQLNTGSHQTLDFSGGTHSADVTEGCSSRSSSVSDSGSANIFQASDTNGPEVELMFRFPDGSREVRSFSTSSKLQVVLDFVASKGLVKKEFDLVLNFPVRILSDENPERRLSQINLNAQEVVHVEKK